MAKRFQIAISFAGAQRAYAERLTAALQSKGVATFYDNLFRHELWGEQLHEKFHDIFGGQADYAIVLISKEYVERIWPRYEGRIILDHAMKVEGAYILPIRFDEAVLKGLPDTVHYEKASEMSPEQISVLVCKKLGINLSGLKASSVPPPQMVGMFGDFGFDYSNHNGRYILGENELSFETHWSNASNRTMQASNSGSNIQGIALALGAKSFADITDASKYDFTSNWRRVNVGEYLVLRNMNGFYCVVKILEIRARSHGSDDDHLKIMFVINSDGDFSKASIFE